VGYANCQSFEDTGRVSYVPSTPQTYYRPERGPQHSCWRDMFPSVGVWMYLLGLLPIYFFCGLNIIDQWNRRGVMRLGKYAGNIGPGLCWIDPAFCRIVEEVSLRDEVWDLELKSVLTKDNVPISLNLVLTTHVVDVDDYIVNVDGADSAVESRALAAATQLVGENDLATMLHDRENLHEDLKALVHKKVEEWGVCIVASELSDPKITDPEIEKAISLKARAQKEGEAELARAQMQEQVAVALNTAAAKLTPAGWQLKDREVLLEMTRSAQNNTVLLPTGVVDLMKVVTPAIAKPPIPVCS
jgi:regulator of protease activity HflC (stomatin/prohibitin superfamily)